MSPKPRGGTTTIDEVTAEASPDETPVEQLPQPEPPPAPTFQLPSLPTEKTITSGALEDKMTVIFGPPGVGKSTLASQWGGGDVFFFNCAGELGELEVYQESVTSWDEFRGYAAALAANPDQYTAGAVDTADVLGNYCSETIRKRYGIRHESDLEWGVGWSALRDEWRNKLAKLAAIPNFGVVLVTHSTEVKVRTRSAEFDKHIFRGVKGIRESMLDMADLVLFVNYAEGDNDEERVIHTKPSRYWDAKERGQNPRLPAQIHWPIGTNGWDLIKELWEKGGDGA